MRFLVLDVFVKISPPGVLQCCLSLKKINSMCNFYYSMGKLEDMKFKDSIFQKEIEDITELI